MSLDMISYYKYHNPASISSCFATEGERPSCATTTTMGLSGDVTAAFNLSASAPIKSV